MIQIEQKRTQFRVSSHTLAVETGRYIGIERKIDFVFFVPQNNQKQSITFCKLVLFIEKKNECFINFAWRNITLLIYLMSTENKRNNYVLQNSSILLFKQREKALHKT